MNKKTTRLLIFIGIAILVVVIMNLIPEEGGGGDEGVYKSGPAKDFQVQCDSLMKMPWNSGKYTELKLQLESLKARGVIGATDGLKLEEYLDQTFAQVLQKACKAWMNSDGNTADRNLLLAMQTIANNPNCVTFVADEIDLMQCYFNALQIPGRVKELISDQYNASRYDQLITDINTYCNKSGINHFNRLISIKNSQQDELSRFKNFAETYTGRMQFYNDNDNDSDAIDNIRAFCPDSNPYISNYAYYLGDIQSTPGICN